MTKYSYQNIKSSSPHKKMLRIIGIGLILSGLTITGYVFLPLILWQIFLSPVFDAQNLVIPIPHTTVVSAATIKELLNTQVHAFGTNDNDARTWFTGYQPTDTHPRVDSYTISIPAINIQKADVSTVDSDLGKHLVNLQGTSLPPEKGNTVIFGHSTLPYLFDPTNYHTIFAHAHELKIGDAVFVHMGNVTYTYRIFSITVVSPDDTSVLAQTTDDSYVTIITCTPPGTIFARLIVKSRLETLQ